MQTKDETMEVKPCQCGSQAQQVIKHTEVENGFRPSRIGWYCAQCRAFDKAIGRERIA
jgi:hypothetical protein